MALIATGIDRTILWCFGIHQFIPDRPALVDKKHYGDLKSMIDQWSALCVFAETEPAHGVTIYDSFHTVVGCNCKTIKIQSIAH